MHVVLKESLQALDLRLPRLEEAAEASAKFVKEARGYLRQQLDPKDVPLDAVVFGSVARAEATAGSDFDCLVIAHGLPRKVGETRELLNAVDEVRDNLDLKRAGPSGIFETVISAPDLTERIGLEQDTNLTHSRRVLLLQESISIYQPELRANLLRQILDRYLSYRDTPKPGVPRFLLNDVVRYWRTIAVDYQAKRWEAYGKPGWGLRFLKLVISRKLAFAGTLASLLLCKQATVEYFTAQFDMPALARLSQLHSVDDSNDHREALQSAFLIAEEFEDALATGLREEASAIASRSDVDSQSRFSQMRDRSVDLQKALEVVFFESSLENRSRKYLVF